MNMGLTIFSVVNCKGADWNKKSPIVQNKQINSQR